MYQEVKSYLTGFANHGSYPPCTGKTGTDGKTGNNCYCMAELFTGQMVKQTKTSKRKRNDPNREANSRKRRKGESVRAAGK